MDLINYISTSGAGYSKVDLGSSKYPSELSNPQILNKIHFQKPGNESLHEDEVKTSGDPLTTENEGIHTVYSMNNGGRDSFPAILESGSSSVPFADTPRDSALKIPDGKDFMVNYLPVDHRLKPYSSQAQSQYSNSDFHSDNASQIIELRQGSRLAAGEHDLLPSPSISTQQLSAARTFASQKTDTSGQYPRMISTMRHKREIMTTRAVVIAKHRPPLITDRSKLVLLQGNQTEGVVVQMFSTDTTVENESEGARSPTIHIVDNTLIVDDTNLDNTLVIHSSLENTLIISPPIEGGEVTSSDHLNPSKIIDNRANLGTVTAHAPLMEVSISTPVDIEHLEASDDDTDVYSADHFPLLVVSETIHGIEDCSMESMQAVVIQATDLVQESTVSQNSEEEVGLQLVEARLVDSKTSTPPELVIVEDDAGAGPSSPMTAFATFTVIRALIRLQRRIKHRYQKQREDLINELGL